MWRLHMQDLRQWAPFGGFKKPPPQSSGLRDEGRGGGGAFNATAA